MPDPARSQGPLQQLHRLFLLRQIAKRHARFYTRSHAPSPSERPDLVSVQESVSTGKTIHLDRTLGQQLTPVDAERSPQQGCPADQSTSGARHPNTR
jgi:hypothetical protein